jgi:hypothetical protein
MRLSIKNIRKGDHFWERNKEFMATEDARSGTIEIKGKVVNQYFIFGTPVRKSLPINPKIIKFMETEGMEHYGPKLESDSISHIAESQIEHIPTLKDYTGWFYNLGDDVK